MDNLTIFITGIIGLVILIGGVIYLSDTPPKPRFKIVQPEPDGISESYYAAYKIRFRNISIDKEQPSRTLAYHWDFGDESSSQKFEPSHKYPQPSSYTITLRATDTWGKTKSIQKEIYVRNTPPRVDFVYSPKRPIIGNVIKFLDRSKDLDGEIKAWKWTFIFGNQQYTSNGENPEHIFHKEGKHKVTLRAIDDEGTSNQITKTVSVGTSPLGEEMDVILGKMTEAVGEMTKAIKQIQKTAEETSSAAIKAKDTLKSATDEMGSAEEIMSYLKINRWILWGLIATIVPTIIATIYNILQLRRK